MSRDLTCTFCGATLYVTTRLEGRPYLQDSVPDTIECDGSGCYATWNPDGSYVTGGKDDD